MKNKYNAENQLLPIDDDQAVTSDASFVETVSPVKTLKSQDEIATESRRAFIRKYGALAAITPLAMTLTLHSKKALASSCTECGP